MRLEDAYDSIEIAAGGGFDGHCHLAGKVGVIVDKGDAADLAPEFVTPCDSGEACQGPPAWSGLTPSRSAANTAAAALRALWAPGTGNSNEPRLSPPHNSSKRRLFRPDSTPTMRIAAPSEKP